MASLKKESERLLQVKKTLIALKQRQFQMQEEATHDKQKKIVDFGNQVLQATEEVQRMSQSDRLALLLKLRLGDRIDLTTSQRSKLRHTYFESLARQG